MHGLIVLMKPLVILSENCILKSIGKTEILLLEEFLILKDGKEKQVCCEALTSCSVGVTQSTPHVTTREQG